MRKFARHPLVWVSLLVTPACGKQGPSEVSQQKAIIDQDSLTPVTDPDQLPSGASIQAIGRMTGGCTAFHVGEGLVATAGHCLPRPAANMEETPCHAYSIQWAQSRTESRCLRYKAYRYDDEADYALMQVDPAPPAAIEVMGDRREQLAQTQAIVVGFPKDRELSQSGYCNARWSPNAEASKFFHSCDTLPGNSGSPVIDTATAQVIGVHDGDADRENYGSFLPPPASIRALLREMAASAHTTAQAEAYGPFRDGEERILTVIGRQQGPKIGIDLRVDLEDGYDKLIVVDGIGRRQELTGRKELSMELPTPVILVIVTDYSGTSQAVQVRSIRSVETH